MKAEFCWTVLWSVFPVKYLNAHTGIVFLRFPKKCYRLLWSALPFITCVETRGQKIQCFLNCLHVGGENDPNESDEHYYLQLDANSGWLFLPGTIRTCQKFLIRYNKQQLHQMLPKCKNKGESRCSYWTASLSVMIFVSFTHFVVKFFFFIWSCCR